ncbi:MAG: diguanylate cyclase [Lachnospiraceae bacterium]|nr:diguanylate cyclase [Lachnospiraceae bacterium]
MKKQNKAKIAYVLQAIAIVPLILFGIAILLVGNHSFTKTMYKEVEQGLKNIANGVIIQLELSSPGDYYLEGDDALRLYKGDTDLTNAYTLVDVIKENTGMDVSLYYQDTRILTTIRNKEDMRLVGSAAPQPVMEEVFATGEAQFYHNMLINGNSYFAYYTPLFNSDGSVVGMLFMGRPTADVDTAVQRSVYPLVVADVLAMIVISICLSIYMRSFASTLTKIDDFLMEVSDGNLSSELHPSVLRRGDEIGDIGRLVVNTQRALRTMVETDALTELPNRRSADRKLTQIIEKSKQQQTPFCIVIGDIDFFKKVNDTYGHDCGDLILKNTAAALRKHMNTCGFASRWGGEEFLLVFDHMGLEKTVKSLQALLDKIRSMESEYEGHTIKITMTFGVVEGDWETDVKELFRIADEKLYAGKTSGRNRIVS